MMLVLFLPFLQKQTLIFFVTIMGARQDNFKRIRVPLQKTGFHPGMDVTLTNIVSIEEKGH